MTTNLIRLLGAVKARKEAKGEVTRPAAVVLPLSPNHGVFGFDGLYAESKLGLESLFNKWSSESWEDYLVLAGAVIGWTRGTGLMAGNNIAARGVEERGCRTFSTQEMALNIVSLFHDSVLDHMFEQPVWADFGGGFEAVDNLNEVTSAIRKDMLMQASCERAVLEDKSEGTASQPAKETAPLASNRFEGTAFPTLPDAKFREKAGVIRGLINLEKTVVVVGFGEVGPWGSSRTRWEMEAHGAFTVEGCIEMAWLMGMISYFNGKLPDNKHYIGWIDTGTKAPIPEHKIKEAYETQIVEHAGVRLINSEQLEGYNPKEKLFLQQVAIAHDMDWIEVADKAEAMEFRTQLGAGNVDIRPAEGGQWEMKLKKGAVLHIPKAKSFDRLVAGQVPDGWDALRYGVPQDIVHQVDPVTLHTIVATGEALISAGITDPYEFYHYVHVSDVGNSSGGGMGGMRAIRRIFGERMLQKSMQSDILQESFINTMTAWVNMLLLSSSGPIKTPVGACATAAESVDIAVETILSGKAKVMVAGGYDGFSEESSYEFAQMKATSNSEAEIAMGREPKDMCRPTSTTRGGFMEAQGAGMQLLMTADLAVKMGCPIFGIVALTNTATDKVGRSVPAPGQGILTTARETRSQFSTPMLDVQYRKKNLEHTMRYVESWRKIESDLIEAEAASILSTQGPEAKDAFLKERTQFMERECIRLRADAQVRWGMTFYQDTPDISPLRGALSVWGLDVDDISVATFHGTGTKLNDKNESDVTNSQLAHLGRTKGNPCMVVCQKWLTGHPKGAAAAWMLNGALQMMSHGVVPGNRNADNVDAALEQFDHLLYPNRSLEVGRINAVLLKSFGFGQAGGEVLVVHPDYLLAALDEDQFSNYCDLRGVRERGAQRALHEALADKRPVVRVKTEPPYTPAQEKSVYLDPLARVNRVAETGEWAFSDKDLNVAPEQQEVPVVDEDAESIRTETEALLASLRAGPRVSASDTDYRNDIASNPLPEESRAPSPLPSGQASPRRIAAKMELAMRETAGGLVGGERGVGIDVEPIKTFEGASKTFINRNFTEAETAYCLSAPNPAASFAGRWAAKEAVIKAISSSALDSRNLWRDSAAPLKDIHVRRGESGAPYIELDGHAKMVAAALGVTKVQISISYFADNAVAQAVAMSGAQPK
jgi:phosphopantetheine--protein transferase-like protein